MQIIYSFLAHVPHADLLLTFVQHVNAVIPAVGVSLLNVICETPLSAQSGCVYSVGKGRFTVVVFIWIDLMLVYFKYIHHTINMHIGKLRC